MDIREYLQKEQKGFYNIIAKTLTVERRIQLYNAINDWHESELKLLGIVDVVQRTWLFCGGHGKNYFEIKVSAEDRESAIAYFETDYPELKWVMTEEL